MGLPIDLNSFLMECHVSVQRFDAVEPGGDLLRRIDGMLARVGRLGREVDSLYHDVELAGQSYGRLVAAAQAEMADGGPANLSQIIDELLKIEQNYAEELAPRIRRSERFLAKAMKDEMLVSVGLVPVLRREIAAMVLMMEQIRDARWQLMVIRAEVAKSNASPATDSPTELAQNLKALRS